MTTAEKLINSGYARGVKKGLEEGREKGLEEGREKGLEEGRDEGRERGKLDGALHTIQAFLSAGVDWDTITKATGYTQERFEREYAERFS